MPSLPALLPAFLSHLPKLTKQPASLVSKNNACFVSKNPWYVPANGSRNSAFPPCPTKPTHPAHTHTHYMALFLSLYPTSSLLYMLHYMLRFRIELNCTQQKTSCKVLESRAKKWPGMNRVRVWVAWVMRVTQAMAQISEVIGQGWGVGR